MNAVEVSRQAQIGPIIHDQPYGGTQVFLQFPGLLEHYTRIPGFVPVLQQCATGSAQFLSKFNEAIDVGVSGCVQDGVEAWQYHARFM